MNPKRPDDIAPGGMGGSARMHDPSEAEHDRRRRRWMNVAFLGLVPVSIGQWAWTGIHGWGYLRVALLIVAGVPLALAIKVFELQFKMAREERSQVLTELPMRRKLEFAMAALLTMAALGLNAAWATWALWGMWGYDFITYYHDRPERMRHLYAVTKILDELRDFPWPWVWAVPAVIAGLARL